MKHYTTIGILMGVAIFAQVSTASAQRWGREATPRSGVCFYENINFDGRYFCTPAGATVPEVPSGMNDRISSVRVFGNAAVTLYRDPDFRGQAKVVDRDIADLRGLGFNDRLSSYDVESGQNFGRNGNNGRGNNNGNGNGWGYGNAGKRVESNRASRWTYAEAQTMVRRSYRSVLGREPDSAGLRNWTAEVMNNNWSQQDLERAFRQSDEFRASHGPGRTARERR
jgi:hypothetical protein